MAKYIDREALIEWLKRIPLTDLSDGRGLCRVIMEDNFKKAIKEMPKGIVIDVEPVVHGHWICHADASFTECSVCHNDVSEYVEYPRCMFCGAKMDGGDNSATD